MNLDELATLHEATEVAKRHCRGKGLRYVDAQMSVEAKIRVALDNERARFADSQEYLKSLQTAGRV